MPAREGRQRTLLAGSLALLLLVLGLLAYLVASSQAQARRDLQRRFRDRAKISAAVAEGVFASIGNGSAATPALTARRIDPSALDRLARQGKNAFIVVRDGSGRVIAASTGTPAAARGPVRGDLRPAFRGDTAYFSGVVPGPRPAGAVVEWGIPYRAHGERRVEVVAIPLPAMAKFLGDFLGRLPNSAAASAAVLDPAGRVVGSPDRNVAAGRMYADRALLAASRGGTAGDVGDRYFATAPVTGSSWRIVIAAAQDRLYSDINGSRRTVPWLMLAILALVSLAGLYALRRATLAQEEVYRRQLSRRTALEINDNVIQRLAVVKFGLEQGREVDTEGQVGDALREAQRLVNQLLGEEGAEPGSLRRSESGSGAVS